jgi:hypothetical protein
MRFILRFFIGAFLLAGLIVGFIVTHLQPLLLDVIRSRYPDIIISIEDARFRLPLRIIAKGIYLQHVEDASGSSPVYIPELDLRLGYDFNGRRLTVESVTIANYSVTIDKSKPDNILPFIAFAAKKTGEEEDASIPESQIPISEIRIKDGLVSIIGATYNVVMNLNMSIRASVKEDKGYDVSGSLKKFKAISYDVSTKLLDMEFETYIQTLSFDKPLDIGNMHVRVNNIPAELKGQITSVPLGYKVATEVSLDNRPVSELLNLLEYKIPVVSDFDIESPAQVRAKVIYDPEIREFIIVSGTMKVSEGAAKSKYYGVTVEGLSGFLPFKYIGTLTTYLWVIGGHIPDYGEGILMAEAIKYDRYMAEHFKSGFVFDGSIAEFKPMEVEGYKGNLRGSIAVQTAADIARTRLLIDITGLDMTELLKIYKQKKFNITGTANGTVELELLGNYINNINVQLKTEDGIFTVDDIGKSLAALPGGDAAIEQIKKGMGKAEYWNEFVKALRNYPYDDGKIDVAWDPRDKGSVRLDLFLKGKKPKAGTTVFFPTVPITIGYHGINAITDLFNIDKVIGNVMQNK